MSIAVSVTASSDRQALVDVEVHDGRGRQGVPALVGRRDLPCVPGEDVHGDVERSGRPSGAVVTRSKSACSALAGARCTIGTTAPHRSRCSRRRVDPTTATTDNHHREHDDHVTDHDHHLERRATTSPTTTSTAPTPRRRPRRLPRPHHHHLAGSVSCRRVRSCRHRRNARVECAPPPRSGRSTSVRTGSVASPTKRVALPAHGRMPTRPKLRSRPALTATSWARPTRSSSGPRANGASTRTTYAPKWSPSPTGTR